MEPEGPLTRSQEPANSEALCNISTKLVFYGEELLAPRSTPKLEDHTLSAVHECLFKTFAATLSIWWPSPPSVTLGRLKM
jgi:hypothetical protein